MSNTKTVDLRELMQAARIGPHEMARECGVVPQAVQQWLRGVNVPRPDTRVLVYALIERRLAENEQLAALYKGRVRISGWEE